MEASGGSGRQAVGRGRTGWAETAGTTVAAVSPCCGAWATAAFRTGRDAAAAV